ARVQGSGREGSRRGGGGAGGRGRWAAVNRPSGGSNWQPREQGCRMPGDGQPSDVTRGTAMSTPEENKGLARRWFEEVWNQRRTATIYELLRPDSGGHTEHGDRVGPEAFAELHAAFLAAFPDLQLTVEAPA